MFSRFTPMVPRNQGLRAWAGVAVAAVVAAGAVLTALHLRGQATGIEGPLSGYKCKQGATCTGTPGGIVALCTAQEADNSGGLPTDCYVSISYATSGICGIPFITGNCYFWQTPCYTYKEGQCAMTQPPGFQGPIPACMPFPANGKYVMISSANKIAACR